MADPNNILASLRVLSWRGIEARFSTEAPYTFGHRQPARAYPYLDVDGHDHTGRQSSKITVKVYFMNSLEPNSYPQKWYQFRDAILDGSPGILVHPDLGKLTAVVMGGSIDMTAQNRAGIVVSVSFDEHRDNPDQDVNARPAAPAAKEVAQAADAAIAALRVLYPDGLGSTDAALAQVKLLYPDGAEDTGTVLDLVTGVIAAFETTGAAVAAKVNQANQLFNQMVDGIEALNDPAAWPGLDNLIQASTSLAETAEKYFAAQRPTRTQTLTTDTTLDAFAESVGNSLEEIVGLNPSALFSPIASRGITLSYYAG
jgi:prophage DNA circulation protein